MRLETLHDNGLTTGRVLVMLSSPETRSEPSSAKYSVLVVELGGYGIEPLNTGGICGERP